MKPIIFKGIDGTNPLGFLAAVGLLRLASRASGSARLGFLSDGSFHPFFTGFEGDIAELVFLDAKSGKGPQAWSLEYEKREKKGTKLVADLKAPPAIFARFLATCVDHWIEGRSEAAAYAAAFGTSVAVDGKGNTKPTAFHFTAANQQFLGTLEEIRKSVTSDWVKSSIFSGQTLRSGRNLRFDPGAERNWALMSNNPNDDGTSVNAPLEWLAFRGLPLFPTFPHGDRVITTAVTGRGDDMALSWPLWSLPITLATVRSVLQMRWTKASKEREMRGIFAVCTSAIRRSSQGFGNFGPAKVTT